MKVKNFVLKEIADQTIVVPTGDNEIDFSGVVTLNDTAKFMWEVACNLEDFDNEVLKKAIIKKYEIDDNTAENAVNIFIDQMKEVGCIE